MTNVVGAGLAGLIAGHIFPNAKIFEREKAPRQMHNALLRFRSDAVSLITGIPFRKVRVHKAIWEGGHWTQPNPATANRYSLKVLGKALPRSVWDISSADRYVAPEDMYHRMVDHVGRRIEWNVDAKDLVAFPGGDSLVSTMPLPDAADAWLDRTPRPVFHRASIVVERARIKNCDLHQTIYLPGRDTSTYRVSITGDLLIIESMSEHDAWRPEHALSVLGLDPMDHESIGRVQQSYGKIAPVDDRLRKELIHRLSVESKVYSLGRFGTWRNILLDDIVDDVKKIKHMIEQDSVYERRLVQSAVSPNN